MTKEDNAKLPRSWKFKKEYIDQAYILCKETDARNIDLANRFNVHPETIVNWKHKYPSFREAIIKGKKDYWQI